VDLNADFAQRVIVHAARLGWTPSPIAGVERRMLDRIGGEVARATSIVRYAPASQFSAHTHGGGEEFIVLDGVFQDEHGDYPVGSYIRNPPTSRHTPGSAPGCTIFVKLWQFDPKDRTQLRINTATMPYVRAVGRPGVEVMPLFHSEHEDVRLERWSPGATITLPVPGGAEVLVLATSQGVASVSNRNPGCDRHPAAVLQATAGVAGCTAWAKTDHLLHIEGLSRL
jgi:anti-sigma factor ChrR (cupin superfamily)